MLSHCDFSCEAHTYVFGLIANLPENPNNISSPQKGLASTTWRKTRKTFPTIAYYGLVDYRLQEERFILVYRLEENGSPPWEGDDMSAKFIGELVLQEILCSWHQVLQAPHTLRGVFSALSENCEHMPIPSIFLLTPHNHL